MKWKTWKEQLLGSCFSFRLQPITFTTLQLLIDSDDVRAHCQPGSTTVESLCRIGEDVKAHLWEMEDQVNKCSLVLTWVRPLRLSALFTLIQSVLGGKTAESAFIALNFYHNSEEAPWIDCKTVQDFSRNYTWAINEQIIAFKTCKMNLTHRISMMWSDRFRQCLTPD